MQMASLGSPIEQKPVVYVPPNFVVTSWSPTVAEGISRSTWERRQKRRPEHFANAA
jgi:hypothetical protein